MPRKPPVTISLEFVVNHERRLVAGPLALTLVPKDNEADVRASISLRPSFGRKPSQRAKRVQAFLNLHKRSIIATGYIKLGAGVLAQRQQRRAEPGVGLFKSSSLSLLLQTRRSQKNADVGWLLADLMPLKVALEILENAGWREFETPTDDAQFDRTERSFYKKDEGIVTLLLRKADGTELDEPFQDQYVWVRIDDLLGRV